MRKSIGLAIASLGLIGLLGFSGVKLVNSSCTKQTLIAGIKEEQLPEQLVHGGGLIQYLTSDSLSTDIRVANIQLNPKAHSSWLTAAGGSMIIVTEGEGIFQSKGKPAIKIQKGDRIEVFPGLYHWIGSADHSGLAFISVTAKKADSLWDQKELLSNQEYQEAFQSLSE